MNYLQFDLLFPADDAPLSCNRASMGCMDDGDQRPLYRVLSIRMMALAAVALILVAVGVTTWLLIAFGHGTTDDSAKLDAIKTAGTIVVGVGGAGALWLAARRQRTDEIALKQKDLDQLHHERVAVATEIDAAERRVTELYAKSADQLGSDKAPVRLAGMYALERLAQNNPDQQQTIVNVLCAYLRMPYTQPTPSLLESTRNVVYINEAESPNDAIPSSAIAERLAQQQEQRNQERQVRLAAQRILLAHLRPGDNPAGAAATFWADIDLDLSGAVLIDFELTDCEIHAGQFIGTQFSGKAWFYRARFSENVNFNKAVFDGGARFIHTQFGGDVRFAGDALWLAGAQFHGEVDFVAAQFNGTADFNGTRFDDDASFGGALFRKGAWFTWAQFKRKAWFSDARFASGADFGGSGWDVPTQFNGPTWFLGARVRTDVSERTTQRRLWPYGYTVKQPDSLEDGQLEDNEGQWVIWFIPTAARTTRSPVKTH